MSDISLAFEADQLAIDNEWIPGYDTSGDLLAQWVAMQKRHMKDSKKF